MAKKAKSNKSFTTLDELKDETLGKVGTKKRDKFEDKSRKETKKDLQRVIDGKETMLDMDVITDKDLQGYSYEEMLDKAYGKKGTPTRDAAEKRIKERAKNLMSDIEQKEAKETNEDLFLKFAKEFSENAEKSSAGDKIPSVYLNDKSDKFRIDYYLKIRDRKTGKIVQTSARIGLVTGIIEVSKTAFIKYTIPKRIEVLLSLYAKWVNKNELNKDGKQKSTKSVKSTKVLVKRKPKKAIRGKIRKGKKNSVRKKNSKKSGSTK